MLGIERLKKRREKIEENLINVRNRIAQDTQNALRLEGAILDMNELIAEIEKDDKAKKVKEDEPNKSTVKKPD
jgi:predicted  nucleic acid-binding Zn-ribbon protein